MLGVFSSCSILLEGVGSAVSGSTYPSKDADMQGAETDYCRMEAELQEYLDARLNPTKRRKRARKPRRMTLDQFYR